MAHVMVNYPFRQNQWNRATGHPAKDASLYPIAEEIQKLQQITRWIDMPQLTMFSQSWIFARDIWQSPGILQQSTACRSFGTEFGRFRSDAQLGRFPHIRRISEGNIRNLQKIEPLFLGCLKSVNMGDSNAVALVAKTKSYTKILREQAFATEIDAQHPKTLFDFVSIADKFFRKAELDAEKLRTSLLSSGIGFFSFETEADEFSLEWAAKLGVKPQVSIDFWKRVISKREAEAETPLDAPGVVKLSLSGDFGSFLAYECAQAVSTNFRTANDTLLAVPYGLATEPHHHACYRAFDIAQEDVAHKYQVGEPVKEPVLPSYANASLYMDVKSFGSLPSWDDAMREVKSLKIPLLRRDEWLKLRAK